MKRGIGILLALFLQTAFASEAKIRALLAILEQPKDFKVKIAAAQQLGKISNATVAPYLASALEKNTEPSVRLSILMAIAQIPESSILSTLINIEQTQTLSSAEHQVINRAFWTFRNQVHQEAWASLLKNSSDASQRALAVWILGVTDGMAFRKDVLTATHDKSPMVRQKAYTSLGYLGLIQDQRQCEEATRSETNPQASQMAKLCVSRLEILKDRNLPASLNHKVRIPHLPALNESKNFTPENLFGTSSNNNPDELTQAIANLQSPAASAQNQKTAKTLTATNHSPGKPLNLQQTVVAPAEFYSSDADRLKSAIAKYHNQLSECHNESAAPGTPNQGKIVMSFTVTKSGQVSVATIDSGTTLKNYPLQSCLLSRLKSLKFSPLRVDGIEMTYTMQFKESRTSHTLAAE